MPSTRALLCAYGTRGDIEPFLALAKGMQAAGMTVTLASSSRYRAWAEGLGVPFYSMSDDAFSLIESPDGRKILEGAGLLDRIISGVRLARRSGPINDGLMQDTLAAARAVSPDLIVFHAKLFGAPHVAEALGIPAFLAQLQPMIVPTGAFSAMGLPSFGLPFLNRLTYALVQRAYAMFRKPVNRFRERALGLGPVSSAREVLFPTGAGTIPVLHAFSQHVLPRPDDWPESSITTGYWRLEKDEGFEPPADLAAFLSEGPPPVFVGFGSMTSEDPAALGRLVAGALRKAGQRGVIAKGWAELEVEDASDVILIPPTPFDWLFPRMAAVVHHGGAGTSSEGFHAGVPCVICPFFGDQPGWAALSVSLGVGATSIPRRRLTEERLAAAIRDAVASPDLRANALLLAEKLRRENGVEAAINVIRDHLQGRQSALPSGGFA